MADIDCDSSSLVAAIPFCLAQQGEAVVLATMANMLCAFNAYANGETDSFECDLDTFAADSSCLAEQGTLALSALNLTLLCSILGNLAGAVSLCGTVDPDGVVIGMRCGQVYVNTVSDAVFHFQGTPGTSSGWV